MKVAVVGATGLVGSIMIKLLEERNFPLNKLITVASEHSAGKKILFRNEIHRVVRMEEALSQKPDIAIFSAGSSTSQKWAGKFSESGCYVIDNSSAWRMEDHIPLVVPEINPETISKESRIIANPNCSTIQLVVAISPLHKKYHIKRAVVSTYQSVTGSGVKGVRQLENERKGIEGERAYPHPIDLNLIPQGGDFLSNAYTSEEMKLINESRKIMQHSSLQLSPTVVRVPVLGGHSESVNLEFENDFRIDDVYDILKEAPGLVVNDKPILNKYPTPLLAAEKDEVFVGRIRRDDSAPNCLNLWIVSDNLRKGAATNAIQIAEYLIQQKYV